MDTTCLYVHTMVIPPHYYLYLLVPNHPLRFGLATKLLLMEFGHILLLFCMWGHMDIAYLESTSVRSLQSGWFLDTPYMHLVIEQINSHLPL